jgi:hypothetical protein
MEKVKRWDESCSIRSVRVSAISSQELDVRAAWWAWRGLVTVPSRSRTLCDGSYTLASLNQRCACGVYVPGYGHTVERCLATKVR